MRKRFISILLACLVIVTTLGGNYKTVQAAEPNYLKTAEVLKQINLFYGTDKGFELERNCSRVEGTVVFLRMIGEETFAKTAGYSHDFKDVKASANWASPYIAFAFNKKLAFGVNKGEFGIGEMSANQFATFLLRALGYSDVAGEFSWKTPFDKMIELGIVTQADVEEINQSPTFSRDLVAKLSYKILFANIKDTNTTLLNYLLRKGVFTEAQLQLTKDKLLIAAAKQTPEALNLIASFMENKLKPVAKKEQVATVAQLYAVLDRMVYNLQATIYVEYTSNEVSSKDVMEYFNTHPIFIGCVYNGPSNNTYINYRYTTAHMLTQYYKSSTAINNSSDQAKELMDIVNKILVDNISIKMTDYEKEKAIHDFMVTTYAYEYDNYLAGKLTDNSYTVWGLIKNKTGVCQAYAEVFKLLMDIVGIECNLVSGKAGGEGHIWNNVKLDGEYYQVDVTWNDPVPDQQGVIRYNYFNITDEQMAKDHIWYFSNYDKCNGTKYDYYRMSGIYANTRQELQTMASDFILSGETEFKAYAGFDIGIYENYWEIAINMLRAAGCRKGMLYYDSDRVIHIILED